MPFNFFRKQKNRWFHNEKQFTGYNYNSSKNNRKGVIRNKRSNKNTRDYRTKRYYEDKQYTAENDTNISLNKYGRYSIKDYRFGFAKKQPKYYGSDYTDGADDYDDFNDDKQIIGNQDNQIEAQRLKFINKYDIETEKMDIKIDNLIEKTYPANVIHIKRKQVPLEAEIKKLVDVKNGKIVKVKKGKLTYKDIKKIAFFALSDVYYAQHRQYPDLIMPMDPLCYENLKNGGSFNATDTFHPSTLHDKDGEPVEPQTLKQKLVRVILRNMEYMHPYPVLSAVAKPQKVYVYKTNIRWLNRKYLTQSMETKKGKLTDLSEFKPVMDYVVKCAKVALSRKKDSVVALPIALSDKDQREGHAVLFTCQYDRKANKFLIKLINTNGHPDGYELYAKPLFVAFKKLLPYYIGKECRLEARYSDLNNQVGGTCMQFSNQGGENVLKNVPVSQINLNQITHGATIRATEAQLCKTLGVKIGRSDAVVKDVSDEINALCDKDVSGIEESWKKFSIKEYNNEYSVNNVAKSGVRDYIGDRKEVRYL